MIGKIIFGAECQRCHVNLFSKRFYQKFGKGMQLLPEFGNTNLGSSWSTFVYEVNGENWLIMHDSDDGSGGTPMDCKLVFPNWHNLLKKYNIKDYVIFKNQMTTLEEQCQHYPFKWDIYPTAIMSDNPDHIHQIAKTFKSPIEKCDIDVIFVGGHVHDKNQPYCWPKNRNINQWLPGVRTRGYKKLQEIQSRRKDINFFLVDGLMNSGDFYNHLARSKICIDLPGTGQSSRKFFEYLVLGKCALSLKQQQTPWDLVEDIHYASLGYDWDFNFLEDKIENLLNNQNRIEQIQNAAKSLRPKLTHDWMADYMMNTVDQHIQMKQMCPDWHSNYLR